MAGVVDAYASEPQYLDHIAPIWTQLPSNVRGRFFLPPGARFWATGVTLEGVRPLNRRELRSGGLVMVASIQDHVAVGRRPTVFVEHGAGQSYDGDDQARAHAAYSGGARRTGVRLFICPSEGVAARNRRAYPESDAVVVGCPKLDPWHGEWRPRVRRDPQVTIAVSFHADLPLCPETRSALPHFDEALPDLARRYKILGHGHPRLWGRIERRWQELGVECVPDFRDVLDRADLYVCDNSSTLYEFASTNRPVVVMNAPWYRRDVEHGLRFWSHVPGVQVDEPQSLLGTVALALRDAPEQRRQRAVAVAHAYAYCDGRASVRAARAVEAIVE